MFGLPKFGDGIAFGRLSRFFEAHRIDLDRLSRISIAVTGSNGKGSTARFIASTLETSGLTTGCFTSPHLFDVRERFLIGQDPISKTDFDRLGAKVMAFAGKLPEGDRMGGFEYLFLLAILWFEETRPDAIVWEAGIGGRYDPIRTVRATVSVLTSLELEHTQLLGATEELIAYDKIDALAPGGTLVVSPAVQAAHRRHIEDYCRLTSRKPRFVADEAAVTRFANHADGTEFDVTASGRTTTAGVPLIGRHQVDNALAGFTAAKTWRGEAADFHSAEFAVALARVRWPGRLEKVASEPDLWVDVGHTPNALDFVTRAFLDIVPREKALVVFGVSASKEVARIAEIVAGSFDRFILTRAHKSGAELGSFRRAFAGRQVIEEPDIARAAQLAKTEAEKRGLTVLAAGGLFLAVELQHAWRGGDPRELDFF